MDHCTILVKMFKRLNLFIYLFRDQEAEQYSQAHLTVIYISRGGTIILNSASLALINLYIKRPDIFISFER